MSTSTYRALTPQYYDWMHHEFGHVHRDKKLCTLAWKLRGPDFSDNARRSTKWRILKTMKKHGVDIGMEIDFHNYLVFGVSNAESSGDANPWGAA